MTKKLLIYAAVAVGISSVVISLAAGNEYTLLVKPLFLLLLFVIYTVSVKKINFLLFLALGSVLAGEALVSQDFEKNFFYISILFGSFFALGFLILLPVVKKTKAKSDSVDLATIIISGTVFAYLVISTFFLSTSKLQTYITFGMATVAFCLFVISCFYIAGYQKSKISAFLLVVGLGYTVVCIGSIVYELLMSSPVILALVNLSEVTAQFFFVYSLIHLNAKDTSVQQVF